MSKFRRSQRLLLVLLGVMALSAASCDTTGESTVAEGGDGGDGGGDCSQLEGETITLVVPFSPGGGYDSYARLIAPFLGDELGAEVVVKNQDGAGGLLAINNLVAAEPDGTQVAIMNAVGVAGGALAEHEGVQFELEDLSMIGRLGASYHIFSTGAGSPYKTIDDVRESSGFRFGTTGPGAADYVNANVLIELFDLDAEVISGFEGSEENELALTKGEIDGMTGDFDSRIPAIEAGDHRPLLLLGPERDDAIPDTPALGELDLDEEQRQLAESLYDLLQFGRPIVGPPNMPEELLGCLRDALQAVVENPELVDKSEQAERPINWMTGEELDGLVQELNDAPEIFVTTLESAYDQS